MGMLDAVAREGGVAVPGCAFRATSGGPVDHAVLESFISKTVTAMCATPDLDGVFVSLHGATQTTGEEDACGAALEAIRAEAGKGLVIAVSCDMHANITDRLSRNADFIAGYLTYPHIDHYETGFRAARFGMRMIRGEEPMHTARARIPMIVPASGYSSTEGAFKEILDRGAGLVNSGDILDFSVFQMQPWLDVSCASSSVLVTAADAEVARSRARDLAEALYANRRRFWPSLMSIDEILDVAQADDSGKPVLLIDAADSPNAGAAGDSAVVVARLLEKHPALHAATIIADAGAVETAFATGVGNKGRFRIGSSLTPGLPDPIETEAYVQSLHDGIFTFEGSGYRGMRVDIGRSAVIRVGMIDILVCRSPGGTGDPQIYRHFGIEPSAYQLVVVKANTSFREQFAPIASRICMADTHGAATADLTRLPYRCIPRESFYPFSDLGDDLPMDVELIQ